VTVSRTLRRAAAAGVATVVAGSLAVGLSPGGASAQDEFINGSGKAEAKILRVGPSTGRLSLSPTVGVALADYIGTLGRGQALTADFAALGTALPPEVTGALPAVRAESSADNAGTPQTASVAGTPAGTPVQVGGVTLSATGKKDPRGSASATLASFGIPGVLEIGGVTAESQAGVVERSTREAIGTTRIASIKLGGGLVTLNGLTWEAVQRTGEGEGMSADFRVESVTMLQQRLLGLPVPTTVPVPDAGAGLGQLLGQINTLLQPTGLVISMPTPSLDDGIARIGPLAIQIVNSQLGQTLLGPVLGAAQPIRDPLTGALLSASSDLSTAILLADVVTGVLSGAGRADVEIGGASAFTEGERFVSPFGSFNFGSFTLPEASGESFSLPDSSELSSAPSFGGTGLSTTPGSIGSTSFTPPAKTGATATAAPSAAPARTTATRQTAVPAASSRTIPGERGGAAALIGLLGLLAALGVASMDYRHIRSNRRSIVVS